MDSGGFEVSSGMIWGNFIPLFQFGEKRLDFCGRNAELLSIEKMIFFFVSFPRSRCWSSVQLSAIIS